MLPLVIITGATPTKDDHIAPKNGIVIYLIQGWEIKSLDDLPRFFSRDHRLFIGKPDRQHLIFDNRPISRIPEQDPQPREIPINPVLVPENKSAYADKQNRQNDNSDKGPLITLNHQKNPSGSGSQRAHNQMAVVLARLVMGLLGILDHGNQINAVARMREKTRNNKPRTKQ